MAVLEIINRVKMINAIVTRIKCEVNIKGKNQVGKVCRKRRKQAQKHFHRLIAL